MTIKRSRKFDNTVQDLSTLIAHQTIMPLVNQNEENYSFLIASPEKALCDVIIYTPQPRRSMVAMQEYLCDDLRLDMDEFYR